jgi:hypothetical protein
MTRAILDDLRIVRVTLIGVLIEYMDGIAELPR